MNGLRDTWHRRAICHSIGRIISEGFLNATLVTLHCSSTVVMPSGLAKRIFKTWAYKIQRRLGSPFRYIRITDYGPHPIPEVIFYLVADLPLDICHTACGEWYMGKASVSPLDEDGVDKIARAVVYQSDMPNAQIWSYCSGKRRPRARAVLPG